jgi:hypothetical protein
MPELLARGCFFVQTVGSFQTIGYRNGPDRFSSRPSSCWFSSLVSVSGVFVLVVPIVFRSVLLFMCCPAGSAAAVMLNRLLEVLP